MRSWKEHREWERSEVGRGNYLTKERLKGEPMKVIEKKPTRTCPGKGIKGGQGSWKKLRSHNTRKGTPKKKAAKQRAVY